MPPLAPTAAQSVYGPSAVQLLSSVAQCRSVVVVRPDRNCRRLVVHSERRGPVGNALFLVGEGGIGNSRLVLAAAELARGANLHLMWPGPAAVSSFTLASHSSHLWWRCGLRWTTQMGV